MSFIYFYVHSLCKNVNENLNELLLLTSLRGHCITKFPAPMNHALPQYDWDITHNIVTHPIIIAITKYPAEYPADHAPPSPPFFFINLKIIGEPGK